MLIEEDEKSHTTKAHTLATKEPNNRAYNQQPTMTDYSNIQMQNQQNLQNNIESNNLDMDYENDSNFNLLKINLSQEANINQDNSNDNQGDNNELNPIPEESNDEISNNNVKKEYQMYKDYKYKTFSVKFSKEQKQDIVASIEDRNDLRSCLIIEENKKLIIVNVNGHEDSGKTIEVLNTDYLRNKKKVEKYFIIGSYIYDNEEDKEYNFANKKQTVLDVFSSKISGLESRSAFIIEEKKKLGQQFVSPYEGTEFSQIMNIANNNSARYLISSYNVLKGPFGSYNVLHKNLHNMLLSSRVPNIILKDFTLRKKNKKNKGGYNWFILFDHSYINCFKAFTTFVDLIDKENDHVFGFAAYPKYITFDIYEKQFNEYCQHHGFMKYSYESQSHVKSVADILEEKINYETSFYDYLVFYNNSDRHAVKKESSESWKTLKKIQANICFINNIMEV